jgi:hypothetical protein
VRLPELLQTGPRVGFKRGGCLYLISDLFLRMGFPSFRFSSMTSAPFTGARRLRELLKDPKKIVVCPGVFDGLTARIALSKGFDALYMVWGDASQCSVSFDRGHDSRTDYLASSSDWRRDINVETGVGRPWDGDA